MAQLFFREPLLFFALFVPLLYSVIAHEVAHGVVAYWFGDDTARRRGRLTLNPLPHFDPVGTAMLFLVGFGWAKPVPVDYSRLRRTRTGMVCVALAGCAVNILLAVLALLLLHSGRVEERRTLSAFLALAARINIMLAAFNLIPIPPLDGSKVVLGFLPEKRRDDFARLEPYGFFILILLLATGLLEPMIARMQEIVLRLISMGVST